MGILKKLSNFRGMGFDIEYWNIKSFFVNKQESIIEVTFQGFSSEKNKKQNNEQERAIAFLIFDAEYFQDFSIEKQNEKDNNIQKMIYNKIHNSKETGFIKIPGIDKVFYLNDGKALL